MFLQSSYSSLISVARYLVQHGIEKGRNSTSRKQVRNDYGQYGRCILPGMSVPTLSASRMEGLFIEDPNTGEGLSQAHFHPKPTPCRNRRSPPRTNLPNSYT